MAGVTHDASILESVDTESTVAASFSRQPSDVAVKKISSRFDTVRKDDSICFLKLTRSWDFI